MRFSRILPMVALLAAALVGGASSSGRSAAPVSKTGSSGTAAKPATKPIPGSVTSGGSSTAARQPATPADSLGPGAEELAGFSFLAGRWQGALRSGPIQMDIAIDGSSVTPGRPMRFDINARPAPGTMSLGVEGDYRSFVTWSAAARSLRAVVTDKAGRGVELIGGKAPDADEWHFDSTDGGAPFPFKVDIKPVGANEVLVAYSSGGRFPLKYEITFHRVAG